MKRVVVIRPAAEADWMESKRWYDGQRPGLGHDFLEVVGQALQVLEERAERFPVSDFGFTQTIAAGGRGNHQDNLVRKYRELEHSRDNSEERKGFHNRDPKSRTWRARNHPVLNNPVSGVQNPKLEIRKSETWALRNLLDLQALETAGTRMIPTGFHGCSGDNGQGLARSASSF